MLLLGILYLHDHAIHYVLLSLHIQKLVDLIVVVLRVEVLVIMRRILLLLLLLIW